MKKGSSLQWYSIKIRGRKSNYIEDHQHINVEKITELENHSFLNTGLITVSGKDYKCIVKPLSDRLLLENTIFTQFQGS